MEQLQHNLRAYGKPPFNIVVVHGGPGVGGEMAPVAQELSGQFGVLEPIQTAASLAGQIEELRQQIVDYASLPVAIVGYSWGAWLGYLLAAQEAHMVRKLILVSSGPFESRYVPALHQARMSRLDEGERIEFDSAIQALRDANTSDKDRYLARLGALTSKTDTYETLPDDSVGADRGGVSGEIFQQVWEAAARLRQSGELLAIGNQIRCPVVAIHGDYDPHPAEGVEGPLSAALNDFQFVLLEKCGHCPWKERYARTRFYRVLRSAIS